VECTVLGWPRDERRLRNRDGKIIQRAHVVERSHQVGTELQRRRFTADEYYRIAEAGILHEDDRVELVDGEIVEMTPIGSPHAACVDRLALFLQRSVDDRGIVRVQGPIRLDAHSEPQPDLSVLKPRADFYASGHPAPSDVLLVVEVADTSLRYDRDVKVPLYARAAIAETWLVDLLNERVEIFSQPTPHGYQQSRRAGRGERLTSSAVPAVSLLVDDIIGHR
jgi:Uma2 family endonuclease